MLVNLLNANPARQAERPTGALLFAETSGAPFGPPLGRDAGRGQTVDVLVSLPLTGGGA